MLTFENLRIAFVSSSSGEVGVDKRIRQLKLIDCTNMGKFVLSIEV